MRKVYYAFVLAVICFAGWAYTWDGYVHHAVIITGLILALCIYSERVISGHTTKLVLAALVVIGILFGIALLLMPQEKTAIIMYSQQEASCDVYVFDGNAVQFNLPQGNWTQAEIEYKLESTFTRHFDRHYSNCTLFDQRTRRGA